MCLSSVRGENYINIKIIISKVYSIFVKISNKMMTYVHGSFTKLKQYWSDVCNHNKSWYKAWKTIVLVYCYYLIMFVYAFVKPIICMRVNNTIIIIIIINIASNLYWLSVYIHKFVWTLQKKIKYILLIINMYVWYI